MIRKTLYRLKSSKAARVALLSGSLSLLTIYLAFNATDWWHAAIPVILALALGVILGNSERK